MSILRAVRFVTWLSLLLLAGAGSEAADQTETASEPRGSLAGERAAQELRLARTNEAYNLHYGPLSFQTEARLGAAYTDNLLLSGTDKRDDFVINPEIKLSAFLPVGHFNTLRLALGVGYEWFAKNHNLNGDVPLVSPDSELVFYLFVGDFRIKLREKFSYQQTLVFNQQAGEQPRLYNFTEVGRFDRLNNFAGPTIDWDLNKIVLSVSYDHENFISTTEQFKYLDRSSEWLTATANFLGDRDKGGVEGQVALHNYDRETILNDNWRVRAGPFVEVRLPKGATLRTGGGYDIGRFDSSAAPGNDYNNWYAYGKVTQSEEHTS